MVGKVLPVRDSKLPKARTRKLLNKRKYSILNKILGIFKEKFYNESQICFHYKVNIPYVKNVFHKSLKFIEVELFIPCIKPIFFVKENCDLLLKEYNGSALCIEIISFDKLNEEYSLELKINGKFFTGNIDECFDIIKKDMLQRDLLITNEYAENRDNQIKNLENKQSDCQKEIDSKLLKKNENGLDCLYEDLNDIENEINILIKAIEDPIVEEYKTLYYNIEDRINPESKELWSSISFFIQFFEYEIKIVVLKYFDKFLDNLRNEAFELTLLYMGKLVELQLYIISDVFNVEKIDSSFKDINNIDFRLKEIESMLKKISFDNEKTLDTDKKKTEIKNMAVKAHNSLSNFIYNLGNVSVFEKDQEIKYHIQNTGALLAEICNKLLNNLNTQVLEKNIEFYTKEVMNKRNYIAHASRDLDILDLPISTISNSIKHLNIFTFGLTHVLQFANGLKK